MPLHRAAVGAVCANSMHIQLPLKVIPSMLLYLPAYMQTLSVCQAGCLLSWVHMHNLHPGANLHPGCKFAPRVQICTPGVFLAM